MENTSSILLLGIGNILWADEGFGVRVVETLNDRYVFPEHVRVVDGGTQGLYLLGYVQESERVIVFDAVDYGLEPGTLKVVYDDEVPAYLGVKKMSLHQTGFQEVLACAQLSGRFPRELVLIGVQPCELEDFGGSLRDPVKAQIDPSIDLALGILSRWNVIPIRRKVGPTVSDQVSAPAVGLDPYESGRPSADEACRFGDPRVLNGRSS